MSAAVTQGAASQHSLTRKAAQEPTTHPEPTLDAQLSVVALQGMLDNGQPQASSPLITAPPAIDAIKPFGQARQMLRADPDAGIRHRNL
jgi:hypothetical protein